MVEVAIRVRLKEGGRGRRKNKEGGRGSSNIYCCHCSNVKIMIRRATMYHKSMLKPTKKISKETVYVILVLLISKYDGYWNYLIPG